MNGVFTKLHEDLQDATIQTTLNIQQVIDDFDGDPAVNPFAIAAGAFGIGAGLTGPIAPLTAVAGVFAGAFGIAAQFYQPADATATFSVQLGDYFAKSQSAVEDTLTNAFGKGNASALPSQTEPGLYTSEVARFMADGKFLIESVEDVYGDAAEESYKRLRQAMAIQVLKSKSIVILIDMSITQDVCTQATQIWLADNCWGLYYTPQNALFGESEDLGTIPTSISDHFPDYGIDYTELYQNAFDCMKAHPDGSGAVDPGDILYDGTLPLCFFNIPVLRGTWDDTHWSSWDL